jgi:hypothetical protein
VKDLSYKHRGWFTSGGLNADRETRSDTRTTHNSKSCVRGWLSANAEVLESKTSTDHNEFETNRARLDSMSGVGEGRPDYELGGNKFNSKIAAWWWALRELFK